MLVSTANPKRNNLQHGNQQREKERAGIADDVQELLAADGNETVKEGVHRCDSP